MSLEQFKRDTRKIAKANGVKIRLLKRDTVKHKFDNLPCSGFFSSETKELCVGIKGKEAEWVSVFIHESCHMDQYIENRFLWDKCEPAYNTFSHWINGKGEYPEEVLEEAVQDIIRLELDCEKRAIEKIIMYGLKIDLEIYIQLANICLYGYLFFYEKKTWCNDVLERRSVTDIAPKNLRRSYKKIPVKFHRAMQKEFTKLYVA